MHNGEQLDIFNTHSEVHEEHYLEDVPEYAEKYKKFLLAETVKKMAQEGQLIRYDMPSAEIVARDFNTRFGEGVARVEQTKDLRNNIAYRIIVATPYRNEFEDILDRNGEVLPSKAQKHAA
jgi:predicted phage-related endonuclease